MTRDIDTVFQKSSFIKLAISFSILPWGNVSAVCNGGVTVTTTLVVSANCAGGNVKPLTLDTGANVTINSGITVSNTAGSGRNGDPVAIASTATSSSLTNNGIISTAAQWGVTVNGTLTSLINTGTITSGTRRGVNVNGGTITTLTNTGSITGPFAGVTVSAGSLQTFNNLQGAGNANGAVTYAGILPTNYNIIINSPTTYGKMTSAGISGTMTFGIYGTSTVTTGTYASVLNGFAASDLAGPTSGTYSGFSWVLSLASGSTTIWDLAFTPAIVNMAPGSSYTLSNIGVSANPVFDGGTLALSPGANSNQAFTLNAAGGTISAPSTGTAQLTGNFSGTGALTVNGAGILEMSGNNTYSGGTTVNSGTLSVSGNSPLGTGSVFVASGSTLMGTGTIRGPVTVAGTLKPGHSPGYLAVNATVTMNSGSTYQQDIAGTVQASAASPAGATGYYSFQSISGGQFVIQPNATLTPRLGGLFTPAESGFGSTPYTPVLGDRFRVVTADGGISGRFTTLTQPAELSAGTQFVQFYNVAGSNSLDLAVIPTSYTTTLGAQTTNTRSAANALDQIVRANQAGTASSQQDQLLYAASGKNAASLPAFTRGLAGEIYGATLAVVPQATSRMQNSAVSHLGDINTSPADSMIDGKTWGGITYQRGHRSSDQNASGYTSNLYQLIIAHDAYKERGTKAGGGLTLSNTEVSAQQGAGTVQQGALFLYAALPLDALRLDTTASVGAHSSDVSRIDPTGYTAGLGSTVRGWDTLLSAGLSRPMSFHETNITPYARITWQHLHQSALGEGSSAAALRVNSFDGDGVRGVIGVSVASKGSNPSKEALTYRLNVALGADTSTLTNPLLKAALAGASSEVRTPRAGAGFLQLGLNATTRLTGNTFAYLSAAAEARRNSMLGTINAGVLLQF